MRRARLLVLVPVIVGVLGASTAPALAERPAFVFPAGCCFYDGGTVRTVVPPAAFPNEGNDAFYVVMDGYSGQRPVVGVAPGDVGYHGGHWAFNAVTWNEEPYLLTSEAAVLYAEGAGDVTVTRVPGNDFLCPIQL